MPKFVYELSDGKVRTRKIRGSGREAAMRAAAAAPKGTVVIGKARKVREVVGSTISDSFVRVASPTKSIVCIRSEKTGTVTCVDRPTARRAQRAEKLLKVSYGLGTGEQLPKDYLRRMSNRPRKFAGPATESGEFPGPIPPSGFARMNPGGYGRMSPMARRRRSFAF